MPARRTCPPAILRVAALIATFAFVAPAAAQLSVNKGFSPATVLPSQTSTLTIQLQNTSPLAASNVALTDALPTSPTGLSIAAPGLIANTCGGTLTATVGGNTITLANGVVPAESGGVPGGCAISVAVVALPPTSPTSYANTIPAANVTSSLGSPSQSTSATLAILAPTGITGTKAFTPANVHGNGPAVRMRIVLTNNNAIVLTGVAFTDTFPTTIQLATTPNVVSTCGGTVTAASLGLTLALSGGSLPANGSCAIEADIVARNANTTPADANSTNSIAINGVTSAQGVRNAAAISGVLRVQKAAQVAKAFAPTTIPAGGVSTLTITLRNFNSTAISNFTFTDAMPAGLTVTGVTGTTCSGGVTSFTAGSVTVSNATLAGAAAGIASTACTLTATVTAAVGGSYVNSVPAGNLAGVSYSTVSATLGVTSITGIKAFAASRPQTGVATLTITLRNSSTAAAATITSFTDTLTTMGAGFAIAAAPVASTTCGGVLSAPVGGATVSLAGGAIPIAPNASTPGACTITVGVQVPRNSATGNRTNTIAVGGVVTSLGNNVSTITANLNVTAALTTSKSFAPASVPPGGTTRLTITLGKAANAQLFTALAVSDTLPAGYTVAPTPNAVTTCTGATVNATAGNNVLGLSGGTLGATVAAAATCTLAVDIRAPATQGTSTNTIPVGGATANTSVGAVANTTAATATITVLNGVIVNKSFSPISTVPAGTSRLRLTIANTASPAVTISNVQLIDTLPSGLVVAAVPNAVISASLGTCTATAIATPGAGTTGISGGNLSAGAVCELAVDVTPTAIGNFVNILPIGSLTSSQGISNTNAAVATLTSNGTADISISKDDGVASLVAGTATTYTLVIRNLSSLITAAGIAVVDPEPTGMTFTGWTCSASAGSNCAVGAGTGDLSTAVTLQALGTATVTITALLDADFPDVTIANTATIDPSAAGIIDPNAGNNSATDTDTVERQANLSVTKTNAGTGLVEGATTQYSITVVNIGPSAVTNAILIDPAVTGLDCDTLACSASAGATCPAAPTIGQLQSTGVVIPQLDVGSTVTFTLDCTVTATGL